MSICPQGLEIKIKQMNSNKKHVCNRRESERHCHQSSDQLTFPLVESYDLG